MTKNKEINIQIKEIKEISFFLKPLPLPLNQIELGKNLLFGLGFNFKANIESEMFTFRTVVKYNMEDIQEPVVELENEIVFYIQNISAVVSIVNEEMEIRDDLLTTLAGVAIGTTRGMLAVNTKGSHWDKFPLPILNPKEIIKAMNKEK